MTPLAGILGFAALFALFGWLGRRGAGLGCRSCAPEARTDSCARCPLAEVDHDRTSS